MRTFFKIKIFLLIIITSILTLQSCNKEEVYLCDSTINEWVIANYEQVQLFNRTQISVYPISFQKAILRAVPSEKRKMIWQEKVNYINTLDWTSEEQVYIHYFTEKFTHIDYKYSNEKASEKLDNEMMEMLKEAINKFQWKNEMVLELFFVVGDIGSTTYEIAHPVKAMLPDCDCKWDLGCPGWNCVGGTNWCSKSNDGCGLFGGASCTGLC